MPETETITPESLNRPITAEDVQEGDEVTFVTSAGSTMTLRSADPKADVLALHGWRVTSITRPVAEQPALPSETGVYACSNGYHPITLLDSPLTWRDAYGAKLGLGEVRRRAPLTKLVPAGSEREADQNAVLDWIEAGDTTPSIVRSVKNAREHFALVPEAEGEKA